MVGKKKNRVLVLGHSGKLGSALVAAFKNDHELVGANSGDFDASSEDSVKRLICTVQPDIVLNTVAYLGIDPCERNPSIAVRLNSMFPEVLATLSNERNFLLVHFSTDAVFPDKQKGYYVESDNPDPVNLYGLTKLGGDRYIVGIAKRFYLARVPLMFGACNRSSQFVEKMVLALKGSSDDLRVANDIVSSPTFSKDIAEEVLRLVKEDYEYGEYHIANSGRASLHDLVTEIATLLGVSIQRVQTASYKEFPFVGTKNRYTPLASEKLPPIRSWRSALAEYCDELSL